MQSLPGRPLELGRGPEGCAICVPALRGRPGLRSWTTAQAGQGKDERSHAGGGRVRGGPWGAWGGCRMRVWRFHLNAEFLSLDAVGAWRGVLPHCGGCPVRCQLYPSTPRCDNQRSLQALPNATWGIKLLQNENRGLKVNKEAP